MKCKLIYNPADSVDLSEQNSSKHTVPEINKIFINLSQLKRNFDILKGLLNPNTKFMAVLKGDACGHGMVPIANELVTYKCDAFGVVRLSEAITLRKAGIEIPIMLLSPINPSQAFLAVKYNITPMVDNKVIVDCLNKYATEQNKVINIHIKINTGLNRYGINPDKTEEFIKTINKNYNNVLIEGIYTHFQNPNYNPGFSKKQISLFTDIISRLEKENSRPKIAHMANSSGAIKYPESHLDMVRFGLLLYGLEHKEGEITLPEGINSILTFKSSIIKIQSVRTGESGGYGSNFIANKDSTVAIVGVGYGDGVSRGLQKVLIAGQKVPVVNYFMDSLMVDISDLKDKVHEFDEVVIVGKQENESISWLEACKKLGSYTDEQIQRITKRVPRIYFYE